MPGVQVDVSTQLNVTVVGDEVPDRIATHVEVQLWKTCFLFQYLLFLLMWMLISMYFVSCLKLCTLSMQRAISSKNCDGWFYIKQFNIFQTCLYGIRSLSVSAQTGKTLQTPWYCQSIINLIRALINIGSGWMYSFLKYEGDRAEYFSLLKINYFSYAF